MDTTKITPPLLASNKKGDCLFQMLVDEDSPTISGYGGMPLASFKDWGQAERFCKLATEALESIFLSLD
jgi:hypothetical protein